MACSSPELLKTFTPGMKSLRSLPTKLPANLEDKATIPISNNPLRIDNGTIFQTNVLRRLLGRVVNNRLSLLNVLLLNLGKSSNLVVEKSITINIIILKK